MTDTEAIVSTTPEGGSYRVRRRKEYLDNKAVQLDALMAQTAENTAAAQEGRAPAITPEWSRWEAIRDDIRDRHPKPLDV